MGPFTQDPVRGDDVVNRGYQTRTSECFGYNNDNKKWYVWKDPSLITDQEVEEMEDEKKAVQVQIPNSNVYGYDRYLTLNSYNYDGVMSISPVGKLFIFIYECVLSFLNIYSQLFIVPHSLQEWPKTCGHFPYESKATFTWG